MYNDIFQGKGIPVDIKVADNFLKIAETLTRIGIAIKDQNKLYQSCHILHKRNVLGESCYSIVHFKEMFALDGKFSNISDTDIERRNLIAKLLQDWGLVDVLDKTKLSPVATIKSIKIVPFADKKNWVLESKYTIGQKKHDS